MDANRFDTITRAIALAHEVSRRRLLAQFAVALGVSPMLQAIVDAKNKNKKRKRGKKRTKPLLRNAFGCVDVGLPCRGHGANCCSGLCGGPKWKKGTRDRSRCVAHHEGGCTPERSVCLVLFPAGQCGTSGGCFATTGNAGFCGGFGPGLTDICRVCSRDPDCEAMGFPPGSACVINSGGPGCSGPGANCAGINGSSGTACRAPAV